MRYNHANRKKKSLIRRFVQEVQNQHELQRVGEFMDTQMIDHFYDAQGMPQPNDAVEAFKKFYSGMLAAFPDLTVTIHDIITEGEKVVTYKTFHGTHQGTFKGFPPSGRKISVDVIDIFRLENGKFVEHWAVVDWMSLMQQIGAISQPEL
ncbi:MAG: ester cyclase [Calditrichaeota bacterium]|nr:MAG: ester cyclase [Calditrichota bacterium]